MKTLGFLKVFDQTTYENLWIFMGFHMFFNRFLKDALNKNNVVAKIIGFVLWGGKAFFAAKCLFSSKLLIQRDDSGTLLTGMSKGEIPPHSVPSLGPHFGAGL